MVRNTKTRTMAIPNLSIEGAYDEAIEDAATRIHEASRPQRMNANIDLDDFVLEGEKNDMVLSPPSDNNDGDSDEISAFGGDNSTSSTFTDYDDIESNIFFLEEKKRILRKVKIHREKEDAYMVLNAHDIVIGREPSRTCIGSSSIWSEAKAMIEEFKVLGVGGSVVEAEEGGSSDLASSAVGHVETRRRTSSHSESPLPLSSSPPDAHVKNDSLTRKRQKIDLSMVKHISSTEFAKEYDDGNEAEGSISEDGGNHRGVSRRSLICQHYVSPTERWQQASEMQLSMDSRNWISQAVLKQIFALSNAAISDHRRSIERKRKGE